MEFQFNGRQPPYNDLHLHVVALRQNNLLIEIDRPINKDSEMHPLVRWQFIGGMKENERKGVFVYQHTRWQRAQI